MVKGKIKRLIEMSPESWKLLKAYAAFLDLTIGEANEKLVIDKMSKSKEALDNE